MVCCVPEPWLALVEDVEGGCLNHVRTSSGVPTGVPAASAVITGRSQAPLRPQDPLAICCKDFPENRTPFSSSGVAVCQGWPQVGGSGPWAPQVGGSGPRHPRWAGQGPGHPRWAGQALGTLAESWGGPGQVHVSGLGGSTPMCALSWEAPFPGRHGQAGSAHAPCHLTHPTPTVTTVPVYS